MSDALNTFVLLSTPALSFLTLCVTLYIAFRNRSYPLLSEAYLNLLAPLYFMLSPYREQVPDDVFRKVLALCDKNSKYMGYRLVKTYKAYKLNSSMYRAFYNSVCVAYFRAHRLLGLEHIPLAEYVDVSPFHLVLYVVRGCIVLLVLAFLFIFAIAYLRLIVFNLSGF